MGVGYDSEERLIDKTIQIQYLCITLWFVPDTSGTHATVLRSRACKSLDASGNNEANTIVWRCVSGDLHARREEDGCRDDRSLRIHQQTLQERLVLG